MRKHFWRIGVILLSVVFGQSLDLAAEPVDFSDCRNMTMNVLAKTENILIRNTDFSGITMSNLDNKMFDNWTHHCMGTGANIGKERIRHGFCKHMDPDGDLTLIEYPADPNNLFTWRYMGGTGKFTGITSGGEWKVTRRGKPIEPGTFQFCIRVTGTYELPEK